MDRRSFLKLLSVTFAAPLPVLRAALDPLRAVPTPIANLTLLQLIGARSPALRRPRWSEAQLLAEPAESLGAMTRAAWVDGIEVWARSGYRTLNQQRYLWNAKFRGEEDVRWVDGSRVVLDDSLSDEQRVERILAYTAFPGTSRHHWGTDVDMAQTFGDECVNLLLSRGGGVLGGGGASSSGGAASAEPAGPAAPGREPGTSQKKVEDDCVGPHEWLLAHAAEYGWCLVYDAPRGGFRPEPWHWSYLPFAIPALARYVAEVTPDLLRDRNVDADHVVLDEFASYREHYLLGIHPTALPSDAPAEPAEPAPGEEPRIPETSGG